MAKTDSQNTRQKLKELELEYPAYPTVKVIVSEADYFLEVEALQGMPQTVRQRSRIF